MKTEIKLNLFGQNFGFTLFSHKDNNINPIGSYSWVIGSYSICKNGQHVIMLDYDNFKLEWLKEELIYLQKKHKLSDFYIFTSSKIIDRFKINNFHAICFDKMHGKDYMGILKESNCDSDFKHFFEFDFTKVLRHSSKMMLKGKVSKPQPQYISTVLSNYNIKKKSLPHIKLYSTLFKIDFINSKNHDNEKDIKIVQYGTKK